MSTNTLLPMPAYPWLHSTWSMFTQWVAQDRIPHALLLSAAKGCGAESLAISMARYRLCLSPKEQQSCGRCKSCQLLMAGSHPDLVMVYLEEGSKQIKIEQIRQVSEFVSKTPQQGHWKLVVITPADAMNTNAANALLKNLEEPSDNTLFLLVTDKESLLMPTIKSRCSKMILTAPTEGESLGWLERQGIEDARSILQSAGGSPLTVMDWVASGVDRERKKMYEGIVALTELQIGPMVLAKQWANLELHVILSLLMGLTETLIRLRMTPASSGSTMEADQYLTSLLQATQHLDSMRLFQYRDSLCRNFSQWQRNANVNAALFIESLLLDWCAYFRVKKSLRAR